jgi:hypothetical protein
MSMDDLGRPLGNAYAIAGGEARLYARGLTISGRAGVVAVPFAFPMIGQPAIAARTFEHVLPVEAERWRPEALEVALGEALDGRLCLVAVGRPEARVALAGQARLTATELQDRQLYDIAARTDDGWQVVAPHAVYARHGWTDFGIAHITDMHVARRIDGFRGVLKAARREDAAARMYNWNDRFRGFVRYANYLHGIGVLDVIVATGDNYDYQFERDDDRASGGNAAFLRDLLLGRAPGPDFPDVEELRVPIFMVPGNHDYRVHPYELIFDLRISGTLKDVVSSVPVLGPILASKDLARVPNYHGYHLSADDATLVNAHWLEPLAHGLPGLTPAVHDVGADEAAKMVEVEADPEQRMQPYRQCLGEPGSYVVELGPHRIAMIDSAHDVGMVTEQLAAALVVLGGGDEDQDAFVGGSPNCQGISEAALEEVRGVFADRDAIGLFIVGLHAPLFNPAHDGYAYFLRETQRAAQRDETHGFLARNPVQVPPLADVLERIEAVHPTWFPDRAGDVRDHRSPAYVKRVSSDDHFDAGVSRGHAEQLTRLLAGVGAPRAADVVLAGHTHFFNEYRVGRAGTSDELAYYFDFYTQNPTNYYPTKFKRRWRPMDTLGHVTIDTDTTYVEVTPDARPDARPWPMPFAAPDDHMLQVPPYANPLNSAPDPRAWWEQHRPLVLQTGALGPLRTVDFFSGFRVLAVKNDVIDKIHYVSTLRLEQHQYRIEWNEAIRPEPGRDYHYVERSRPLGSPAAVGVPSAIWYPALGATNVVYRDGDGRLHELWRKGPDAGTSDLTALASDAMRAAGDPTSYIDTADNLEVALYRGTDGHVYSLYWSTGEVRRDALSASVDAPRAAGKPVGYVGKDGYRHVIYRARDGHLHELYWTGPNPPGHGDISTAVGASHAAGDPVAYQKPNGENIVIYRGTDSHVHGLYWLTGAVRHDELSRFARAPSAAGDPAAYHTSFDDVHQVVYRSADGHVHELWWQGNNPVSHWDLTAATKDAPVAANDSSGDPIAHYNAGDNTKHVIYRARDGHLYDLSWVPGTAKPSCIDLTAYAVAPLAADKPSAFVVAPNTQHVLYRGNDNQIHEIRWSRPVTLHERVDFGFDAHFRGRGMR